jgi:hypothetical protein
VCVCLRERLLSETVRPRCHFCFCQLLPRLFNSSSHYFFLVNPHFAVHTNFAFSLCQMVSLPSLKTVRWFLWDKLRARYFCAGASKTEFFNFVRINYACVFEIPIPTREGTFEMLLVHGLCQACDTIFILCLVFKKHFS